MSDEQTNNPQPEKTPTNVPQDVQSQPQGKQPETKQINLSESSVKTAGDQGVFFNPAVGVHTPDPFVSQDVKPAPSSPAQTIVSTSPAQPVTPPVSTSGTESTSGE